MNTKEEGKYYATMVRKFRTDYKSKNLYGFCKENKVSYTKMLHCLRNDSYRKTAASSTPVVEDQGLHPLLVEPDHNADSEKRDKLSVATDELILDDVELFYGSKVSLHIGSCSKTALVSLMKEMEGMLC